MIRSILALVPPAVKPLLPGFLTAVALLAIAQGVAYSLLAPLLEAVFDGDLASAWRWLIALGGTLVIVAVSRYMQGLQGMRIGVGMMRDVQTRLGDHLSSLPLGWFDSTASGRTSRIIISSTREVMGVFAHLLTPVVTAVVTPLVVAIAMLFIDWRVTVAMVVSVPVLYVVNRWGNHLFAGSTRKQHAVAADANSRMIEFAQAQPVLRAFGSLEQGDSRLDASLAEQRKATRGQLWSSVPGLVAFSFFVQVALMIIVWLLVTLASRGELSAASAIALIAVSTRFIEPLNQAGEMTSSIRGATVAAERITGLLGTPTVAQPEVSAAPADASITFSNVSFGYNPQDPVLHDVSFTAPAGTMTAIVGPSGSGKSTLLRLTARFYDTDEGTISIGGNALRDYSSETLLGQLSLVFQDVYLFDQSIEENIRLARPDASEAEVQRAAEIARVDEILERLPDGWNSRVGEGGAALSGGERQRVSIARALLKDTPIVLLDEATSALDPHNEAAVVQGIRELTDGKTVLVVAHRLATIQHADQILFLDGGRIVERGTHDELLAMGGRYASLWHERTRASGWRLASAG